MLPFLEIHVTFVFICLPFLLGCKLQEVREHPHMGLRTVRKMVLGQLPYGTLLPSASPALALAEGEKNSTESGTAGELLSLRSPWAWDSLHLLQTLSLGP